MGKCESNGGDKHVSFGNQQDEPARKMPQEKFQYQDLLLSVTEQREDIVTVI